MKKHLIILVLGFLLLPKAAFASQDINIVCNKDGDCKQQDDIPLFTENNIYPGFSVSKKLSIKNEKNEPCHLGMRTNIDPSDSLSKNLLISFVKDGLISYAGIISDTQSGIELGIIPSQSEASYLVTVSMAQNTGNELSSHSLQFDQIYDFNCHQDPIPSPTPSINIPVFINEFMPSPEDNHEWVEIINQGNFEVTLTGWKIDDQPDGGRSPKILNTTIIPAKSVFVVELGSSFLDNNGDAIVLINDKNQIVERHDYTTSNNTLSWTKQSNGYWCLSTPSKGSPNNSCFDPNNTQIQTTVVQNQTTNSCQDPSPVGVPHIVRVVPKNNGVTLYWEPPVGPMTYYLIAYGLQSDDYKYGNPNIGGSNTTSYTVNRLSSDKTYYFRIRAGNGCAPGNFSQEVIVKPLGNILNTNEPPVGFIENVLGVAKTGAVYTPSVLGQTQQQNPPPTYQKYKIYFFVFSVAMLLYFIVKRLIRKRFFDNQK